MNKENIEIIMNDFDELLASSEEIITAYEDEFGICYGTVDWIPLDDIKNIFYRLEKEMEV